jgi:hypothetical protein
MRKLLIASLLGWTAMMGFGLPRSASALPPGYGTCPSGGTWWQITYYDCATGAWCGVDEYRCGQEDVYHYGCTTACHSSLRASCRCAIETSALGSTLFESAATPPTVSCKAGGEERPTWITGEVS